MEFGTNKLEFEYVVYDSPKRNIGIEVINLLDTNSYSSVFDIQLDSNSTVKSFRDKTNDIFYSKDWEGNLIIHYKNKKGEIKRKKIMLN